MILTGEIAIFSSTTTTVTVESARPPKHRLTVKWHHKGRVDMSEREKKTTRYQIRRGGALFF